MICSSSLRNVIIQVGCIGVQSRGSVWLGITGRALHDKRSPSYSLSCEIRRFRASGKMMVDTSSMQNRGSVVGVLPEKGENGGYASGGCKSEDGKLSCGYSSFRGKRASMEDFFDVKMSKKNGKTVCLFGIFDGHGGSRAAEYLKDYLFENLMKHPKFIEDTKVAISETYKKTDAEFLDSEKDTFRDDGSTASTAVLVENHLYVANVGDSRTVISKAGKAIALSEDHKPNRLDERKRIESAGGVVMWAGTWRVGGVLAMSRAFGNRMLKQFVVAEPEIQEQEINEELELLVLASDGLWDVVPNEDAVSIAWAEEEPEAAARKLTETAFNRGSADNITCIVVRFHHDNAGRPQFEQQKSLELHQDTSAQPEPQQELSHVPERQEDHNNVELQQNQNSILELQQDQNNDMVLQQDQNNDMDLQDEQMKEVDQQDKSKEAEVGQEPGQRS
ncbi:probable protein phosphatase 2C 76 isoform X2 [Chenopodium quinoa]|uniref:probable protein phosphatase 2C 76 isoform X2 n=1 Tax=Chenopodium quinoa TaxID=63459 RepID=UPI000B777171|nr:probable protein phosphatase 2C 76 isoform X2 [Chenopodium quinoa]